MFTGSTGFLCRSQCVSACCAPPQSLLDVCESYTLLPRNTRHWLKRSLRPKARTRSSEKSTQKTEWLLRESLNWSSKSSVLCVRKKPQRSSWLPIEVSFEQTCCLNLLKALKICLVEQLSWKSRGRCNMSTRSRRASSRAPASSDSR